MKFQGEIVLELFATFITLKLVELTVFGDVISVFIRYIVVQKKDIFYLLLEFFPYPDHLFILHLQNRLYPAVSVHAILRVSARRVCFTVLSLSLMLATVLGLFTHAALVPCSVD